MNKIKRNETIEKGILFAAILPQIDGLTAGEVMDKTAEAYKDALAKYREVKRYESLQV